MEKLQDLFIAHGICGLSNLGGVEIQISDDQSMARLRYYEQKPTRWLEIQYTPHGEPYIEYKNDIMYLNIFTKISYYGKI